MLDAVADKGLQLVGMLTQFIRFGDEDRAYKMTIRIVRMLRPLDSVKEIITARPDGIYHVSNLGRVFIKCGWCGKMDPLASSGKIRICTAWKGIERKDVNWFTGEETIYLSRIPHVIVEDGCKSCYTKQSSEPDHYTASGNPVRGFYDATKERRWAGI